MMLSANVAEATACLKAIRWCHAHGIANATILTDSLLIIKFLPKDVKPDIWLSSIISDI